MEKVTEGITKLRGVQLSWGEAARAFLCMIPMLIAALLGQSSLVPSLGQGGFFYGAIPLPLARGPRLLVASLLTAVGLGFYLMGGNVVFNPWLAVVFTFFVAFKIGLVSGFNIMGMLAIHFISIYTAGLNASAPDKVHTNFIAFVAAFGWGAIVSLVINWKGQPPKETTQRKTADYFMAGIRMGVGTSVALLVSTLFGFEKLGWAPSGAGLVIGYDTETSKTLAWARFVATLGGAILATLCFLISINVLFLMTMSLLFTVLNGLFRATKVGSMPLFYTATILILFSISSPIDGPVLAAERIFYNVIGITIGLALVFYPFPALAKRFKQRLDAAQTKV
jgi:uncharacterized membrane protein YccC